MHEEHFRKLENMYAGAPCNDYYAPKLTISKGTAELTIPIQEKLFHAARATHGSVYFKAMDDTAFFAVNSLVEDVFVLTASFTVHLFRPISAGVMKAVSKVVFSSSNLFVAESVVYNAEGKEIGRGSGTFVKSKIPLTAEIGYR